MLNYNLIERLRDDVYFSLFCLVPWPKRGGMAQCLPLKTPLDVHVLMVTAYKSQLETIQHVFQKVWFVNIVFL